MYDYLGSISCQSRVIILFHSLVELMRLRWTLARTLARDACLMANVFDWWPNGEFSEIHRVPMLTSSSADLWSFVWSLFLSTSPHHLHVYMGMIHKEKQAASCECFSGNMGKVWHKSSHIPVAWTHHGLLFRRGTREQNNKMRLNNEMGASIN